MVGRMTKLAEIIAGVRAKATNQKSKFIDYAAELGTELLARQYKEIVLLARNRPQNGGK